MDKIIYVDTDIDLFVLILGISLKSGKPWAKLNSL